jgi:hypothetical protein
MAAVQAAKHRGTRDTCTHAREWQQSAGPQSALDVQRSSGGFVSDGSVDVGSQRTPQRPFVQAHLPWLQSIVPPRHSSVQATPVQLGSSEA